MRKYITKYTKKLHLWLALATGVVSFIVCFTGALYCFRDEINDALQPWRFVEAQEKPFVEPSSILEKASTQVENIKPSAITFGRSIDAVSVDFFDSKIGFATVFFNPYTGEILKKIEKGKDDFDFFSFVLRGHRSLWLPAPYGKLIVSWSIVVFVVLLFSGLILWIPSKLKNLKHNFEIKKARLNFNLHNTLGGIFLPFLFLISLTGLVWSFTWYSEVLYRFTGGKDLKPYVLPTSSFISKSSNVSLYAQLDVLYMHLKGSNPNAPTYYIALPSDSKDCIRVSLEHEKGSYYRTDNLFFDQYTLAPLEGQGPYAGKYTAASVPDKIRRMNLDIHDGRIAGIGGKIIAFTTSLVGISLFVTGLILYIKKLRKRRMKNKYLSLSHKKHRQ